MKAKAERNRRSKGCFDYTTKTFLVENAKYYSCIGNFVKPIDYLVESFVQYEKGIMPFEGGILEQPNKIIEVFNIISQLRKEHLKLEESKKKK